MVLYTWDCTQQPLQLFGGLILNSSWAPRQGKSRGMASLHNWKSPPNATDERCSTLTPSMQVCSHFTDRTKCLLTPTSPKTSKACSQAICTLKRDNACHLLNICYRKKPRGYVSIQRQWQCGDVHCQEVSHNPSTIIFITIILSSPSYLALHLYFPIHHTA